jgi:hypothetical protein
MNWYVVRYKTWDALGNQSESVAIVRSPTILLAGSHAKIKLKELLQPEGAEFQQPFEITFISKMHDVAHYWALEESKCES